MKKLLLFLLLLPLFLFSQLTLETISNINDAQSFKRTMIENGFERFEVTENDIGYVKKGVGELSSTYGFYVTNDGGSDVLTDDNMSFFYNDDENGENKSYNLIYDQVKSECEFVEVSDFASYEVAWYKCIYVKPSIELLELQAYFKKELPNSSINVLSYRIGFNKLESVNYIHMLSVNKANSSTVNMLKRVIDMEKSKKLDSINLNN